MEYIYYWEMQQSVDALLERRLLQDKRIFIFGHCNASEELAEYLMEKKLSVRAILDNSESKQGDCWHQIPIVSPNTVLDSDSENSVVLIAAKAYASMKQQLKRVGFKGAVYRVVDYNTFAEYSLEQEVYEQKLQRVERGSTLLCKIRKAYPHEFLVICPYKALGDVYLAMSYLPHYLQKHRVRQCAVLAVGDVCGRIVQMFGHDKKVLITQKEMDELVQAVLYTEEENAIIVHHDRPYTNNMTALIDAAGLKFEDMYRYGIYGLSGNEEKMRPERLMDFAGKEMVEQGNCVILAPYAKSVISLPVSFWEDRVAEYQEQGLQVFTNVVGEEIPIAGSQGIQIPIEELVFAAEYAGHFVGIRSGLCELVDGANCDKKVFFPDCWYSNTHTKVADFFALPGWEEEVVAKE